MERKPHTVSFNKQIFQLAADHPGITRAEVAARLQISLSKAGYDISNLIRYGLISEIPGNSEAVGRHPSGFRARCPVLFRILDLSTHHFSHCDYTVNGELLNSGTYPYRDSVSAETNLDLFFDRLLRNTSTVNLLMCGMLVPSPERFADPTAPIRPALPDADKLKHRIEEITGMKILCSADSVSAIAKSTAIIANGKMPFFGLYLGDETFSVFRAKNREVSVRPLGCCFSGDTVTDNAIIAKMAADVMYLSGTVSWHFVANRKFCAVRDLIRNEYPNGAVFPTEIATRFSPTHYCLLRRMRDHWFDKVSADFSAKLKKKVAKPSET